MSTQIPFGLIKHEHGRSLVAVDSVRRGDACGCICPGCKSPLSAAKGEINDHHFRHAKGYGHVHLNPNGLTCPETALHIAAKKIISEMTDLTLPPASQSEKIQHPEKSYLTESISVAIPSTNHRILKCGVERHITAEIRPDLILDLDGFERPLCIEIIVTNRLNRHKENLVKSGAHWMLEIDLSKFPRQGKNLWELLKNKITSELRSDSWVCHPELNLLLEKERSEAANRLKTKYAELKRNQVKKDQTNLQKSFLKPYRSNYNSKQKYFLNSSPDALTLRYGRVVEHLSGEDTAFDQSTDVLTHPLLSVLASTIINKANPQDFFDVYNISSLKPSFRYWYEPPEFVFVASIFIMLNKVPSSADEFNSWLSSIVNINPRLNGFNWEVFYRETTVKPGWAQLASNVKHAYKKLFRVLSTNEDLVDLLKTLRN